MKNARIKAVAYLRTSSAANVGNDKDSDKRQLAAIEAFAKANGYEIVEISTTPRSPAPIPSPNARALPPCSIASSPMARRPSSWNRPTASPAISPCSSPATTCCQAGHRPDPGERSGFLHRGYARPPFWCARCWARSPSSKRPRPSPSSPRRGNGRRRDRPLRGPQAAGRNAAGSRRPGEAPAPQGAEARLRSLRAIAAELAAAGYLNERGAPYSAKTVASMLS